MMRALWSASSGMKAMQTNVDTISNNLANVNTTSYKKEKVEFEDLLYYTMQRAYMLEGQGKPVNTQAGQGTAVRAIVKDFGTGSFEQTGNTLDFAIDGEAFFSIMGPGEKTLYTRDGSFKLSVTEDGMMLTNSSGYPVLDDTGSNIYIDVPLESLSISDFGDLGYTDEDGISIPLGQKIGLFKFSNRQALEAVGGNLYSENSATGVPTLDEEVGKRSVIRKGFLEASNVQIVEEMVKLITAQRAYELNSKAIQTSDEMLGLANGLKR